MPNPDGSPTLQELLAANPGLAPGVRTGVPPMLARDAGPGGNILPPPVEIPVAGGGVTSAPGLQDSLAGAGLNVPGVGGAPAPAPSSAPPPMYAEKANPLQLAASGLQLPAGVGNQSLPRAPEHNGAGNAAPQPAGGKPGGAPITYKPPATGGEGLQAQARGFYIPAGTGGGGKPGNPFANQMRAIDESSKQNMLMRGLLIDDARANQAAMTRDAAEIQRMQGLHEAQAEEAKKKTARAEETYTRVLEDAPNESIDADRWWGDRSTGQSIALMLGAGLAGFAAGFSGRGGNDVIDQINKSVDRDISVQRANIAEKRENYNAKVSGAKTTYEMIRQGVQDDEAASALTKAWVYDRMAIEAKQRAAGSQDIQTQQNAQQFTDALNMKKAEMQDKALQAMMKGGGGFDRKLYIDLKQKYLDKGATADEADRLTLHDMGVMNAGNPNFRKEGPGGKEDMHSAEARQHKINAINASFDAALRNPVIDEGGLTESFLSGIHAPARVAPDTAKLKVKLNSINQQTGAAIMGMFKDNEGRIPPPVVDALHDSDMTVDDPPDVRRQKIEARRDIPNTMAQWLPGVTSPRQPNSGNPLQAAAAGYETVKK